MGILLSDSVTRKTSFLSELGLEAEEEKPGPKSPSFLDDETDPTSTDGIIIPSLEIEIGDVHPPISPSFLDEDQN